MKLKSALAAVLAVLTLSMAISAQVPDTPAGRQFSAWLDAFNSGDRAVLLKFMETNYPVRVPNIDRVMVFRRDTGGFDFRKAENSEPARFICLVQERGSDQFERLTIEVEPDAPHHILRVELRPVPRPAEFPLPRMSQSDAIAALRAKLEKDTAADEFAGAMLVARDGRAVFTAAYGLSDREKKTANRPGTQFRMGSMNKMFTAVAVLQLVQAGKIKLNDPLGTYLKDYPNKDVASKVTIHHLLTHTGGTGDIFGPEFDEHRLELKTLQDYVDLYGKRGLKFEPGSRWEYSNYGFLLLGVIVAKVSGQDYYDYVQDHIFKTAGMTSTASLPENVSVPGRSAGYMKSESGDKWERNTDTLPWRGTSAGGGYTTVEDMLRFANALQNHKLLDARHTELLTTGKVDLPGGSGGKYAYGFFDRSIAGVRCFGHGGGASGMNGELEICPASATVIAVFANVDPPAAQREADFIGLRLPEK